MDNRVGRVRIKAGRDNSVIISIKGHNSLLHAFFIILIETAAFSALVIVFALIAGLCGRLGLNPVVKALAYLLSAVATAYKVTAVVFAVRSVLWSAFGFERIEAGPDGIRYSKTVLGIGIYRHFTAEQAATIEEVDYVQEKFILYMLRSELGLCGNSFKIKGKNGEFRFGRYLTVEENEFTLKAITNPKSQIPN